MIKRLVLVVATLSALIMPAFAHRLDEYLQAATIDVAKGHVAVRLHLTPGVEVAAQVLSSIDTNGDGLISQVEQETYAGQVRDDLTLSVDGKTLPLRLDSSSFPTIEAIKGGVGEILFVYQADLPPGGSKRTLSFVNRNRKSIAVYMVNAVVPSDPDVHVATQTRSPDQGSYRMEFTIGAAP